MDCERQILDEEHRQSFRRHLVHRPEREPVAVREGEPLVDPRAARQRRGVHLARRQHDLAVLAVDHVTIVVDRHEIVVRADLLDLPERIEQRLIVPQRHVVERGGVALDVCGRQGGFARNLALDNLVERKTDARGVDGMRDEGHLAHLLVRRDYQALQDEGVELPARTTPMYRPAAISRANNRCRRDLVERKQGAEAGDDDQHPLHGNARVDVDIRRAVNDAGRGGEQLRNAEPRPECEEQEQCGNQHAQVPPRRVADQQPAERVEHQALAGEVNDAHDDGGEQHRDEGQVLEELKKRQLEEVERNVVAQDRVVGAERHGVARHEPDVPLARRIQGDEERDDRRAQVEEGPQATHVDGDRPDALRPDDREGARP